MKLKLLLLLLATHFTYSQVVINEIDPDTPSTDQKEIIELQKIEVDKQRELADSRREIAEAHKQIIQDKQKEILDSIHYAKRIQQAMLTSEEYITENFKAEYFILYQPKDIVSGDFYWAINHENKFIVMTADCTGHGVPGAMMSMMGEPAK